MTTPPQLASHGGLRELTGREYHGLAEIDRQGLLLETQISEILHARERLAHQIEHLLRSNEEMVVFMEESSTSDPDLEEAVSENKEIVAEKLRKIQEIEDSIAQSLPHMAPKALRFSRRLPDGLTYHGSPQGDDTSAGEEEQKGAADSSRTADGPVFGGMGQVDEDSEEELKDDGGVFL